MNDKGGWVRAELHPAGHHQRLTGFVRLIGNDVSYTDIDFEPDHPDDFYELFPDGGISGFKGRIVLEDGTVYDFLGESENES